jgi:hypothetical protein
MVSRLAFALCISILTSLAASEQLERTGDAVRNVELVDLNVTEEGHQYVRNHASRTGAKKVLAVDASSEITDLAAQQSMETDEDEAGSEEEETVAAMVQRSAGQSDADVAASVKLLDQAMEKKGHKHPPQHCEWNGFGGWSNCDKTCGGGTQKRTRSVKKKAERGGNACQGAAEESQACNANPCPIDCEWDRWDDWSDCSKTCGGGKKTRSREKKTRAQHGGMSCDGDSKEEMECSTQDCPTVPPPVTKSMAAGKACSVLTAVAMLISTIL